MGHRTPDRLLCGNVPLPAPRPQHASCARSGSPRCSRGSGPSGRIMGGGRHCFTLGGGRVAAARVGDEHGSPGRRCPPVSHLRGRDPVRMSRACPTVRVILERHVVGTAEARDHVLVAASRFSARRDDAHAGLTPFRYANDPHFLNPRGGSRRNRCGTAPRREERLPSVVAEHLV